MTEVCLVGWHHQLNGLEFEQAPGNAEGQGGLASCSPWGCKESDTTKRLNNNIFIWFITNRYWLSDFPGGSVFKNMPVNARDIGSIPGSGRSREGNGNPLQYSCLGNPMDRGVRQATVLGLQRVGHDLVTKQHWFTALNKFYVQHYVSTSMYLPAYSPPKISIRLHTVAPLYPFSGILPSPLLYLPGNHYSILFKLYDVNNYLFHDD